MNIVEAISSEKLFKPIFRNLDTWASWIAMLKSLFAVKMSKKELALYRECTGREKPPERPFREAVCICGRRSGKSFTASIIACYLGLFFDYQQFLGPGERASIVIIAADRGQARTIFNYITGILHSNQVFENCIEAELKERISLDNRIDIEILTASHRTVRGRTIAAVLLDEAAFFIRRALDLTLRFTGLSNLPRPQFQIALYLSFPLLMPKSGCYTTCTNGFMVWMILGHWYGWPTHPQ